MKATTRQASRPLYCVLLIALGGCSASSVLPAPEPGLERMIDQPKGSPYGADAGAKDGAMMRTPPPGTVPCDANLPGPSTTGMDAQGYLVHLPFTPDAALLDRGQDRFAVVCANCHGLSGDGDSPVALHMETVRPRDLHLPRIRDYPVGRIFQVISDGFGLMPSQSDLLSLHDRWAVAAYVKALQLSRHADPAALPLPQRQHAQAALP